MGKSYCLCSVSSVTKHLRCALHESSTSKKLEDYVDFAYTEQLEHYKKMCI